MSHQSISPDAFLFDIGNVLIDIDINSAFEYWSAVSGIEADTLYNRFAMDAAYHDFETGKIGVPEYMNNLCQVMQIDIDHGESLSGWNAILRDEIPGIRALLKRLSQIAPVYAFSNTNSAHQELWSVKLASVLEFCEKVFTSWEIGMRKPEVESFVYVAEQMRVEPKRILFFDDSIENIIGAQAAGMQTVHVTDVGDTLHAVSPFLLR